MAATTAGELRNVDSEDLVTRLREAKEELFNLRFQAATGQLESHGRLRAVKKDIARIYTVMRERELGHHPGARRPRGRRRMSTKDEAVSIEHARCRRVDPWLPQDP